MTPAVQVHMHQHLTPELRDINGRYRLAVEPTAQAPEPDPLQVFEEGIDRIQARIFGDRRATQAGFASAAPAWLGRRPSERGEK